MLYKFQEQRNNIFLSSWLLFQYVSFLFLLHFEKLTGNREFHNTYVGQQNKCTKLVVFKSIIFFLWQTGNSYTHIWMHCSFKETGTILLWNDFCCLLFPIHFTTSYISFCVFIPNTEQIFLLLLEQQQVTHNSKQINITGPRSGLSINLNLCGGALNTWLSYCRTSLLLFTYFYKGQNRGIMLSGRKLTFSWAVYYVPKFIYIICICNSFFFYRLLK